jgi:hypothetical protein
LHFPKTPLSLLAVNFGQIQKKLDWGADLKFNQPNYERH